MTRAPVTTTRTTARPPGAGAAGRAGPPACPARATWRLGRRCAWSTAGRAARAGERSARCARASTCGSASFDPAALDGVAEVVVSPGVSLDEPLLAEARRRGRPVHGDIELFAARRAGADRRRHRLERQEHRDHAAGRAARPAACGARRRQPRHAGARPAGRTGARHSTCSSCRVSSSRPPTRCARGRLRAEHLAGPHRPPRQPRALRRRQGAHPRRRAGRGAEPRRPPGDGDVGRRTPCIRFGLDAPGEGEYGLLETAGGPALARGARRCCPRRASGSAAATTSPTRSPRSPWPRRSGSSRPACWTRWPRSPGCRIAPSGSPSAPA
jgi:hypothetical protein